MKRVEISMSSPKWTDSELVDYFDCPECKEEFFVLSLPESERRRFSYCPNCGVLIGWGRLL